MLSLAPAPVTDGLSPQLHLSRLSGSAFLLSWTIDAPMLSRPRIALAGGEKRLASASVVLPLGDGRLRVVVVFRHGGPGEVVATLSDDNPGGDITARFDPDLVHGMADAEDLVRDATPDARRMLANALVGHWPTLFGLSQAAGYLGMSLDVLLNTYGHHHPDYLSDAIDRITRRETKAERREIVSGAVTGAVRKFPGSRGQ